MNWSHIKDKLRPLLTARGLITVPGAMALAIWALAVPTLAIDDLLGQSVHVLPVFGADLNYDTTVAVLSTIAAAAITTLSLVYSIVLVVFTLAAGTIAPRLLKRFSNDRTNQATAGLLGGTFLYALTVLAAIRPDDLPALSGSIAFVLAVLSVLQLIFFVHSVSLSVMIDEEIAAISRTLNAKMQVVIRVDEEKEHAHAPMPDRCEHVFNAPRSGFLSVVAADSLVAFAAKNDLAIDFCSAPGDFVAKGEPLFNYAANEGDGALVETEKLSEIVEDAVSLTAGREDAKDIIFSLNLLLEIALRALSPGVNDTYTAISCTNRLAEALQAPVRAGLQENIHFDETEKPRLRIPGLTLEDLLKKSIQPLRQCAADNHLFLLSLAGMIRRLHAVAGNSRSKDMLTGHAEDILRAYRATEPLPTDLEDLKAAFGPAYSEAGGAEADGQHNS
ncbi:DUF2254 domain-containing protein [Roseibium hamelinense]|uniref:DUF2254 domain-containing protein n=1 Tax=Roseibium hamelinense TaxID=150831 RepID=UPI001478D10C|nr:DUF2254 domain-containing protein [Roseibium hamelinense]